MNLGTDNILPEHELIIITKCWWIRTQKKKTKKQKMFHNQIERKNKWSNLVSSSSSKWHWNCYFSMFIILTSVSNRVGIEQPEKWLHSIKYDPFNFYPSSDKLIGHFLRISCITISIPILIQWSLFCHYSQWLGQKQDSVSHKTQNLQTKYN